MVEIPTILIVLVLVVALLLAALLAPGAREAIRNAICSLLECGIPNDAS